MIDLLRQLKSSKEIAIREAICFHLPCDDVGVSALYDACSLLDASTADRAYLWHASCFERGSPTRASAQKLMRVTRS